jgi:GNAT superfamily N-acetyltransferase
MAVSTAVCGSAPAPLRTEGVRLRLRPGGETMVLGPLVPGDRRPGREVFDAMSDRSRYFRFLAPTPRLPQSIARYLADVDHVRHVVLVARIEDGAGERSVGIGRYVRDRREPTIADVALAVGDAHQGRGIGRMLLAALGAVAGSNGVTEFSYYVHSANDACLALLRPLPEWTQQLDDGGIAGRSAVPTGLLPQRQATRLTHLVATRRTSAPPPSPSLAS